MIHTFHTSASDKEAEIKEDELKEPEVSSLNEISDLQLEKHEIKGIPGPLKLILGLFLVLIIVLWMIPHYYLKDNPYPKYIPRIDEVYVPIAINKTNYSVVSYDQYLQFVDYINPTVKGVADRVSSMACDASENYIVCQAKALYLFVRDDFSYVQDPDAFEYIKTPIESLNNLGGDCDDASVLLASLLGSIGIRTRLVFMYEHVYVEAYLPEASSRYKAYKSQDWVAMDATCKTCDFGKVPLSDTKAEKKYLIVT